MDYINKYSIVWSQTFYKEFQNAYEYIAFSLKEPIVAKKFYSNIIHSISCLKFFPERYSKIHDIKNNKNIRKLPVKKYAIIYEINNNTRANIYTTYFSC